MCLWVKVKTVQLYQRLGSSVLVIADSWKPVHHTQSLSSPNLSTNENAGAVWSWPMRSERRACFQEFSWLTRPRPCPASRAEANFALFLTFNLNALLSLLYHDQDCRKHQHFIAIVEQSGNTPATRTWVQGESQYYFWRGTLPPINNYFIITKIENKHQQWQ